MSKDQAANIKLRPPPNISVHSPLNLEYIRHIMLLSTTTYQADALACQKGKTMLLLFKSPKLKRHAQITTEATIKLCTFYTPITFSSMTRTILHSRYDCVAPRQKKIGGFLRANVTKYITGFNPLKFVREQLLLQQLERYQVTKQTVHTLSSMMCARRT